MLIASQGEHSLLRRAVRGDWKGRLSTVLYLIAVPVAFLWTWVSLAIYVVAALLWLVPDRRIERLVLDAESSALRSVPDSARGPISPLVTNTGRTSSYP